MKKLTFMLMAAIMSTALLQGAQTQQQQQQPTAPAQNQTPGNWSRAVHSVDPVHNNGFISDNNISTNFYAALQNDRVLCDDTKRNVEIRVYNGKATLQGKVKDNKERSIVSNLAKRIPGVESVRSNLSTRS